MSRLILITGGAGFIGSSIALALAARRPDWQLVAADNLFRRGSEMNLPRLREAGVTFQHLDVRHPEDLARVGEIDALVECSAEPSVLGAGDVIVPVNLTGAYHCFELAARHGAQVVFLSTSRVYPYGTLDSMAFEEVETRFELVDSEGVAEDFPLAGPRTMYGASKLAAELLLGEYDLPWVVNRCGVVAGPWQMGKVDQGVFTHWMLSHYLGRELHYIGYGGIGKQVRDLLHVDDLVDLVDDQLARPDHWQGRTYNVGGGRSGSLSLCETTALCQQITGRDVGVSPADGSRPGDVRIYLSDCAALFGHTDWRPQRTPSDVLEDIFSWIHDHERIVLSALGL